MGSSISLLSCFLLDFRPFWLVLLLIVTAVLQRSSQGLLRMPFLKRAKGKGRGKCSSSSAGRKPPSSDVEEIPDETPEIQDEVDTHEDPSVHEDSDDEDDGRPLGRRKKGSNERFHLFTIAEEDSIVEWWREREYLYNAAHPWHSDKGKKERAYARKAKELKCEGMYTYREIITTNG